MFELYDAFCETKTNVYVSEDSAWGRHVEVNRGTYKCDVCETVTTVLAVDSSAGEYKTFYCCKPCFENFWK